MTAASAHEREAERRLEAALVELLEGLREPSTDPVSAAERLAPAIDRLYAAWDDNPVPNPSTRLLALARSVDVEIQTLKTKLNVRGQVLARVVRAVHDSDSTPYTRHAARPVSAHRHLQAL